MEAVFILVHKGLPEHSGGALKEGEGVEGVDAQMGARRRMGGHALEDKFLVDEAGQLGIHGEAVGGRPHGVEVQAHIHPVQHAVGQHLELAGAIADFSLGLEGFPIGEVGILLRGRKKERHGAAAVQRAGIPQGQQRVDGNGALGAVAAAVSGGLIAEIGLGMAQGGDGVQLCQQGDMGLAVAQGDGKAGDGVFPVRRQALAGQVVQQQGAGFMLLKAQLGRAEERLAQGRDLRFPGRDGPGDFCFAVFQLVHGYLPALRPQGRAADSKVPGFPPDSGCRPRDRGSS